MYTYTHTYTHIHIYTYTYIYIYIYTYTFIHIFIHTHIYTYTYTHIHTHIYIYIHIHIYTHIHIHIYIYRERYMYISSWQLPPPRWDSRQRSRTQYGFAEPRWLPPHPAMLLDRWVTSLWSSEASERRPHRPLERDGWIFSNKAVDFCFMFLMCNSWFFSMIPMNLFPPFQTHVV